MWNVKQELLLTAVDRKMVNMQTSSHNMHEGHNGSAVIASQKGKTKANLLKTPIELSQFSFPQVAKEERIWKVEADLCV